MSAPSRLFASRPGLQRGLPSWRLKSEAPTTGAKHHGGGIMPARRPRSVNRFHERELARVIRAARKAGEAEARVEVDPKTGKISVVLTPPAENKPSRGVP